MFLSSANKIYLENNLHVQHVHSTNAVYIYDTLETLEGILELEFGFRDSFPAVVANLCQDYCKFFSVPTDSAVHLGAATGRGSFELSKHFCQVILWNDFIGKSLYTIERIQD